jgi:hypothetical protein
LTQTCVGSNSRWAQCRETMLERLDMLLCAEHVLVDVGKGKCDCLESVFDKDSCSSGWFGKA